MRKRFRILLITLLVAGLGLIVWQSSDSPREPSYQGQPVSHWIKVLNNMTTDERGMSYFEGDHPILEIGPLAIPYLIKALRTKDSLANSGFVALWPKLPPSLKRKIPEPMLAARLRAYAARGLGLFGPDASVAVPDLIEALHDKDFWVRTAAAGAFEQIGPAAKAAVPELVKGLTDPRMRLSCLIGLKGAGQESANALPVYQRLLSDPDSNIRCWAAIGLGQMTVEQDLVVGTLARALQDDEIKVRAKAAESLGSVGSAVASSAVPELLKVLDFAEHAADPNAEIMSWQILEGLEKIGPAADAAVPALTNLLNSSNSMISVYAARALWAIEPHNAFTIPCFIDKLKTVGTHSSPAQEFQRDSAQYWALRSLIKIGPAAKGALPLVQQHAGPGNSQKELAAAAAAWTLDASNPPPFDLLARVYHSGEHIMNRRTAVEIIGDLGPAARSMIPLLKEAAKEADQLMRQDARTALDRVQHSSKDDAAHERGPNRFMLN